VRVVASDVRATKQFTVSIDVRAPSSPGTYYIGFFAGWMYSPDEVASNDHPPKYGDGDDVWDMRQSDWESILREGRTPEGAVYGWPGRAIRVVVEEPAKAPDLTIVPGSVKFSPSSVPQGGVITVTWTEKNQGNGDAGPYTVGVYLATTEYGTNYLLGRISRSGLSAGASFTDTQSFRVPDKISPSQYFVTVFIDDSFQVKESNENNNIGSSNPNKVNVEPPMRAARIVSLSTEREAYCMDETVVIRYTIKNTGNVRLHLRVVLEIKDPSDKTIYDSHQAGQDKGHWLDPGQQIYDYFSWKIPRTAPPGVYKVLMSVMDWDDWNMIYDYRWGDKPGPEFKVYALRVRLDSITLNGQTLSTSNPELRVAPGSRITGTVTFTVENVQPGSWITPVIWVTSWERGSVADGKVRVVSKTIWSTQQFTVKIDVTAPQKPGTYYIGFFAGWMYSPDEVASNDHPPEYGNGNDIWDMKQSDWESILRDGRAPEGAVYGWPGRAIRVVVEEPSPQPQRGSLIVKVIDANFAPVPNAEVKLYKWGEGFMLSARTDSSGEVTFSDLEPGFYAVTYVPSTPWELRRVDGSYVGVLEIVGLAPNGDFLVEVKPGENVRWVVKEAVLTVSVKDQEGKPIRDVEVSLYSCVSNGEKLFLTGSTQKTGGSGLVFYRWLSPNFEYLPKYIVVVKTPDVEKSAEVTLTGWEEPAGIKKVEIVLSSKPAPSTPVIPGDMNRNGVLDTGDATILLRKVVGLEPTTPEDITIGDLNGNGVLDTGDATRILRMVVGLE